MIEALSVILATFLSGYLAPKVRRLCERQNVIDIANTRSSHTTPTPRGGGIGIIAVVLILSAALHGLVSFPSAPFLLVSLLGGLVVGGIGYLDDKKGLPVRWRLLAQSACVALALYFLPDLFPQVMPLWAEKTLLFFAWIWFINLYNFMDGLDGLATVQAIFIGLGIVLFQPALAPFALVLIGACLGFLRTNWPPAKIFLGDVGSTFLGFYCGALLLATLSTAPSFNMLCSLFTLPLLFSADATYTLIKRMMRGNLPWQAHREHWYQRAHIMGMQHNQVLWRAILLYIALTVIAVAGYLMALKGLTVLVGLLPLLYAARRIVYLEGK